MKLSLFDLHCDTPLELYLQKKRLSDNDLAVSLAKAEVFDRYVQVMAFWNTARLSEDEGWEELCRTYRAFLADPAFSEGKITLVTAYQSDARAKTRFLLSVEDARVLGGRLERVDTLFEMGFRLLTPLWGGVSCIGGAHNTDEGLSSFGKAALQKALSLGMLLDVSHASQRSTDEILELSRAAKRPVLATHSNAHKVCPVSRNLRDTQIRELIACDGLIGLNLYQSFLKSGKAVSVSALLPHIEHFLALGAEDHLALGGDMDGCLLPVDLRDLSELPHLAELMLQANYPERLIRKLFFENADRFAARYLLY